MKILYFLLIFITTLFSRSLFSQTVLLPVNMQATENNPFYDTRFPMKPDYLYHPLTNYKYYNYVDYIENERTNETSIQRLDEFEKNRLQKTQLKFQANIYKNWQHGFYIDIPLIAENSSDQPYLFSIGKYDFNNQAFPLILKLSKTQCPVNSDHILLDSLKKEAKCIKEPKYTSINGVCLVFTPNALPFEKASLQIPLKDAERFKSNVVNNEYHVQFIVDFDNNYRKDFSNPTFTEDFDNRKNAFGYSSSPQKAKESYLYTGQKPIEVVHFLELFYEIKGFRILDKNNVIMFEWMSDNVSKGTWKVISGSSSQDQK